MTEDKQLGHTHFETLEIASRFMALPRLQLRLCRCTVTTSWILNLRQRLTGHIEVLIGPFCKASNKTENSNSENEGGKNKTTKKHSNAKEMYTHLRKEELA